MKARFFRFTLVGLVGVLLSSCSAANSVGQTFGRMVSAAGRSVR